MSFLPSQLRQLGDRFSGTPASNVWSGHRSVHISPIGEYGHVRTLAKLRRPFWDRKEEMYIGVGGLCNLQFIAQRRSHHVLMLDVNNNQPIFWDHVFDIIHESKTKEECGRRLLTFVGEFEKHITLDVFPDRAPGDRAFREPNETEKAYIQKIIDDNGSWLGNDRQWSHIKTMVVEGRIAASRADVLDTEYFTALAQTLGGMKTNVIYLSNINAWCRDRESVGKLMQNVHMIAAPNAIVIDTDKNFHTRIQDAHAYSPLAEDGLERT